MTKIINLKDIHTGDIITDGVNTYYVCYYNSSSEYFLLVDTKGVKVKINISYLFKFKKITC